MKPVFRAPLACFLLLLGPGAASLAQPSSAELDQLIRQLAAEPLAERQAAMKRLQEIGEPTLEALRKAAAANTDPDVRLRCYLVIRAISTRAAGEVRRFDGHSGQVLCVAFSPDGKR